MKKYFLLTLVTALAVVLPLHAQNTSSTDAAAGWSQLSYDRLVKPAGNLIIMGDSTKEYHTLDCALSPDNNWLAVEERYSIVFVNTRTSQAEFTLRIDSIPGLRSAMSTYSGITWYRKDQTDYVLFSASKTSRESYVVRLKWVGTQATTDKVFRYKPVRPAALAMPNELLARREGNRDCLYVVLNGNNQLLKQDLMTGDTLWIAKTGVAPYGIALSQNKLYVTDWAGRTPVDGDKDVAGVPWGSARVDPETAATREGSVSVFDPETGKLLNQIIVGLHPNKIAAGPDGNTVYITNSSSDEVTVIDTRTDAVTETISLRLEKKFNTYYGDMPNSLAVTRDGKTLYVANGMDNALAVIRLGKKSVIQGFIPTAAFPSSVCINEKTGTLYVTNLESFGPSKPFVLTPNHAPVYNSHRQLASISVIPVPDKRELARYTQTVIAANQLERLKSTKLQPRPDAEPRPIPERIGEPSVFKHVLYIIKENRTYDQVLGDVKKGDGDSTLCTFGAQVTPNMHKLVNQFQLMDNFFVSGKCSAEGHSWTDASIVTDYIEKNMRAWFRSYPHTLEDALVYPPTGFIWDNARKHGVSVRIYGEAATPVHNDTLTWTDFYTAFMAGKPIPIGNSTTLSTVEPLLCKDFPGYNGQKIPDVIRAKVFIDELKKFEAMEGDALPQLMIMALPNDHTIGTSPNYPTPRAMVADNDLALGQIIGALSHSRFWKNTVVFVVEDDSQSGWDHVSAYRTVALVASAYSKVPETISAPYNQPSMVRTIEQILGMPPMNIQDAIATPMTDCFSSTPDFTPYVVVGNRIPLDEMNKSLASLTGKSLHYARLSMDPQFQGIDKGDDQVFNRILWHATMGDIAYPTRFVGVDKADDDDDE